MVVGFLQHTHSNCVCAQDLEMKDLKCRTRNRIRISSNRFQEKGLSGCGKTFLVNTWAATTQHSKVFGRVGGNRCTHFIIWSQDCKQKTKSFDISIFHFFISLTTFALKFLTFNSISTSAAEFQTLLIQMCVLQTTTRTTGGVNCPTRTVRKTDREGIAICNLFKFATARMPVKRERERELKHPWYSPVDSLRPLLMSSLKTARASDITHTLSTRLQTF